MKTGICPICGRLCNLTGMGRISPHYFNPITDRNKCEGGGKIPKREPAVNGKETVKR